MVGNSVAVHLLSFVVVEGEVREGGVGERLERSFAADQDGFISLVIPNKCNP